MKSTQGATTYSFLRTRRRPSRCAFHILALCLLFSVDVNLGWPQETLPDASIESLEQLIDTEVTTVSRIPERRSRVPSAVYVVTQEDIRRSGATSIPEALRLVPGIQVARIDSSKWAIGVRGFASRLVRSMLVLIDGRAVYSPLFAGTYWDARVELCPSGFASSRLLTTDIDRAAVAGFRGVGSVLQIGLLISRKVTKRNWGR